MKVTWPDPDHKTLPPIVEVDVDLTMPNASYSIPHGNGRVVGPRYGIKMQDLTEAFSHRHKFDEQGRIEELWDRRNAILSVWKAAKARSLDPVPQVETMLAEWEQEDTWRIEAAKANGYGQMGPNGKPLQQSRHGVNHFLAAGPCVIGKRVYRDPAPQEKVPLRHQPVIMQTRAAAEAQATGLNPATLAMVQAIQKAMGAGATVPAKA